MCTLIARRLGSDWIPTKAELDSVWFSNPHGFGLSYAKDGSLYIKKTLKEKDVSKLISKVPKGAPLLLHWRFATHGSVKESNCHPWLLFGGEWVGAHNGCLRIAPDPKRDITDSLAFFESLDGLDFDAITNRLKTTGEGKMAFLSRFGELHIANEDHLDASWRVRDEVWQSNDALDFDPFPFWGFQSRKASVDYLPSGWSELFCDYCDKVARYETSESIRLCASCAKFELERSGF